jgi:hypothetical protein
MGVRAWLCLVVLACGCSGGGADDFGGTQSEFEAEADYTCCLNGSFYECSSSDAVLDCLEGDVSGCSSAGGC